MRYTMWTPLPPERSGISDYSYELLGALAELVDVEVAARDPRVVRVPPDVGTADLSTAADRTDVPIYQMGNHFGVHGWIFRQALTRPGLVVLHDTSLLDFNLGRFGGLDAPDFRAEVAYAHGPIWGDPDDPALYRGWPAIEVDGLRMLDAGTLTMERRLMSASRGVLVHDPYAAGWLRERYPELPVYTVPSGAPVRPDTGRAATRARFGWRDEHVVFGIFGGFNRIKRILPALLAFGQVRRRWPEARLLIAGFVDFPEVHKDVAHAIDQFGLSTSVHLELAPGMADFQDLIGASDAVLNLRWPTAGETSAVMMRAFGAGRIVITSDLPQHRHYDAEFCRRVPISPAEEAPALIAMLEEVLAEPEQARAAGKLARDFVEQSASWPVVAAGYRAALDEIGDRAVPAVRPPGTSLPGVNLFADLRATTGLSESARRHAIALHGTGIPMTYTEFNSQAPNRSVPVPRQLAELRGGKDHPIDFWLVNLNEFRLIPDSALDRYTIALWAWELPEVLDYTLVQLPRIDELWVLSSFVADAFRTVTDIPITVIPSVVPEVSASPDRAGFGLAEDAFVVLFTFSASSSDARKNPWGVIEAFRRAFPPAERGTSAQLVIKATDLNIFPELAAALAEAVAEVNGTLIAGDLTRPEMDSLLASCDVYASLHRSEGFGLGMAEAMSLGKAVIATGYGGNTDFMPPGSAAVVGYDVRPITEADHRFGPRFTEWYRPGQLWAEPDVGQAARWLRRLADSPELRHQIGSRGTVAVREWSGYQAVGEAMRRRLGEIDRAHRLSVRDTEVRPMVSSDTESRAAEVANVDFWFHSIDVGEGVTTPGAKAADFLANEWRWLGLPDLTGRSVLDIGAWDGWFSFAAERAGAARVVSLDHYVWSVDHKPFAEYVADHQARGERVADASTLPEVWRPDELPGKAGYDTARRLLGSSAEDVVLDFATDDLSPIGRFDVVLFLGVLYHLADPVDALRRLYSVTGDLAVVETHAVRIGGFEDRGLAEFFPHDEFAGDPSNWWVPNMKTLIGWCEAAGFRSVDVVLGPNETIELAPGESDRYTAVVHARR